MQMKLIKSVIYILSKYNEDMHNTMSVPNDPCITELCVVEFCVIKEAVDIKLVTFSDKAIAFIQQHYHATNSLSYIYKFNCQIKQLLLSFISSI